MSQICVRAARGAIRVSEDTPEVVLSATAHLLGAMLERNGIDEVGDLVSVFFTVTPDLRSAFPAEAARRMGLGAVPLLCAQEIPVAGAMGRVVRVLMHFHTPRAQAEVVHAYLDGAESLRDDLG
ncbi:MAG TPA: chorismate mutase [Actinomycetota bacterium]|jgi:chorismate mutase|nr:chorismate mutase [Actinomycetota bacterium]